MYLMPYIVYSGEPEDGAVLVFAHSEKEARQTACRVGVSWDLYDGYTELRAKSIRREP